MKCGQCVTPFNLPSVQSRGIKNRIRVKVERVQVQKFYFIGREIPKNNFIGCNALIKVVCK